MSELTPEIKANRRVFITEKLGKNASRSRYVTFDSSGLYASIEEKHYLDCSVPRPPSWMIEQLQSLSEGLTDASFEIEADFDVYSDTCEAKVFIKGYRPATIDEYRAAEEAVLRQLELAAQKEKREIKVAQDFLKKKGLL